MVATDCDCMFCKHNYDISSTQDLLDAALSGKLAMFAGAGVSTESRNVLPVTFYEMVAEEAGVEDLGLSFPEMMDRLCAQVNGRYRFLKLLQRRLDTIEAFPELYGVATRFHEELSTLHPVETIITTNWDTYFEDVCRATPFVTDQDLAFWDDSIRRVLKIHGCVRSYGSLVATSEDYDRCESQLNSGVLGGILKSILATRTVVFAGYSLRDKDFRSIYAFVKQQMQGLHKQAYVVTPFEGEAEKFRSQGLIPIITSGDHFVRHLKKHAVSVGAMLPDSIYDAAHQLLLRVRHEHRRLHDAAHPADFPQLIFAACYQDGMMHALERMLNLRGNGESSHGCRLRASAESYLKLQKEKRRLKRYDDVAYIEGYVNALTFLLLAGSGEEDVDVPLYFAFGHSEDIYELEQFICLAPELPNMHRASYRQAKAILEKLNDPRSVEMHHPPWL